MSAANRRRLDQLLVEKGLAETRAKARALVLAGQVLVDGRPAGKAGQAVPADSRLEIRERMPYVSRGGPKLRAALDHFGVRVEDRVCLDIGASTGGFTDCLLQSGARRVYALDVGSGQLDWKLRNHPRVIVKEGLNARYLRPEDLGERVDLAVCDVSFISVTLILPVLPKLLTETGEMVILVKPQFEVGRGQVGKGGIVRDAGLHRAACARVEQAVQQLGFRTGLMESPVRGAEGNKEFFIHARH
jgi:23S rRNA (cytidine1920-2'-O)/16S rRNA (cytidine1409-2'-O)-methyltransferase